MLERPRRPLPRKFRRRVSRETRSFVRKRHARSRQRVTERIRRTARRMTAAVRGWVVFIRRWSWLGLALAVVAVFVTVIFSPLLEIREISIQRTQARVDVRGVISLLTPLYGRHLLFVGTHDVLSRLQDEIPDLDQVNISKAYPHKLVVRVSLKPIVAKLLIEGVKTSPVPGQPAAPSVGSGAGFFDPALQRKAAQKYDYLTENGIYVSTPVAHSGALLEVHIVDWAVRPIPNTPLIAPEFLERIRETEMALSDQFGQKTRVRTVYLRAQEYHLDMGGFSLWFDLRSDLAEQLSRYKTFLKTVGVSGVRQYVDLRVSGRVLYR